MKLQDSLFVLIFFLINIFCCFDSIAFEWELDTQGAHFFLPKFERRHQKQEHLERRIINFECYDGMLTVPLSDAKKLLEKSYTSIEENGIINDTNTITKSELRLVTYLLNDNADIDHAPSNDLDEHKQAVNVLLALKTSKGNRVTFSVINNFLKECSPLVSCGFKKVENYFNMPISSYFTDSFALWSARIARSPKKVLDWQNQNLTEVPSAFLNQDKDIDVANFAKNNITSLASIPHFCEEFPTVKKIILDNNKITVLDCNYLNNLPEDIEISLNGNPIVSVKPESKILQGITLDLQNTPLLEKDINKLEASFEPSWKRHIGHLAATGLRGTTQYMGNYALGLGLSFSLSNVNALLSTPPKKAINQKPNFRVFARPNIGGLVGLENSWLYFAFNKSVGRVPQLIFGDKSLTAASINAVAYGLVLFKGWPMFSKYIYSAPDAFPNILLTKPIDCAFKTESVIQSYGRIVPCLVALGICVGAGGVAAAAEKMQFKKAKIIHDYSR